MQESAVPTETCTCHVEAVFCTESGKLANEFCPEECRETRVLVQGREFLDTVYGGAPQLNEDGTYTVGNLISAADDAAHLTYNQIQGTCTTHTEETVPPDVLVPGDDGFEWPDWWPWNPGDGDEDGNTDPGGNSDGNSGIILETIPEAERMSLRSLWNRRFPQSPQNHKYLSSKPRGAPVFSGALGHFLF